MPTTTPDPKTFDAIIVLPFGPVGIRCNDTHLTELRFLPPDTPAHPPQTGMARRAAQTLQRLVETPQQPHSLPLAPHGTAFQHRVWAQIAQIPYGQTRTYSELADRLDSAPRAVGAACGANPFPLLVPCHRVVGRHGLGGFARDTDGHLLQVKKWLLQHERAVQPAMPA